MNVKFSTFFSKQARKPTGIFGYFYMSRIFDKGNLELNKFVKEKLLVIPNDNILEIGCGTGLLLKQIADELKGGTIEGVDFSKSMISVAKRKNKKSIGKEKVSLIHGNFDKLSFESDHYNKIFSVNTVYFWKDPKTTIAKISKLLKPGGMLVLGFHDKSEMEKMDVDKDVFQLYSAKEITELLTIHGKLQKVEVISKKGYPKTNYCAIGFK